MIQFTSQTGNSKGVVYPHHFLYLYSAAVSDAQAHGRRRPDHAAAAVPRRRAVHHLQLGAACRLYGAPEEPLLGALLLAGDRRRRRDVRDHPRDARRDPVADGRRSAGAPVARVVLRAVPAGRRSVRGALPRELLWQGYGMTEVYPHPMPRELEPGQPYDTIGHAAAWMEYGAVDEYDRVLPPGVPGELVYRPTIPDAMTRGYYKDAEATTKAFRNFMFHPATSATSTRTAACTSAAARRTGSAAAARTSPPRSSEFIAAAARRGPRVRRLRRAGRTRRARGQARRLPARSGVRRARIPRLARGQAAALHGPEVRRGVRRRVAEDAEPEVQSSSLPRPAWSAGGRGVRARPTLGAAIDQCGDEPKGAWQVRWRYARRARVNLRYRRV